MNGQIDWGEFTPKNKPSNNGDRLEFLWLKSGNTYRVRPVAKPVIFHKYFHRDPNGKLRIAICEDPSVCPVGQQHDELETPGERFAILVIDRADGALKVMEFPRSVYTAITNWKELSQQNPGGDLGVDWAIQITGTGKTGTKYVTTPTVATPFTNEEKTTILKWIKNDDGTPTEYLENIFKAHTPEVIEKRLFGEWEDRKPQAQAQQAQPAQAVPAAPAAQPVAQAAQTTDVVVDW